LLVPGLDPSSPLQPKLTRLRRHDLRHSACSLWLRAGVDVTVCQRWSGHKRLSVFLDIYQGLIPGREESGVALLEEALATTQADSARQPARSFAAVDLNPEG
jgi:integrase